MNLHMWGNIRHAIQVNLQGGVTVKELDISERADVDSSIISFLVGDAEWNVRESLTALNVSKCSLLRNNDFQMLSNFPNLREINLAHNPIVEDDILHTLCTALVQLAVLDVSGCPLVTDSGLNFISTHCFLHMLSLKINGNKSISQIGINQLLWQCEKLEVLEVCQCTGIDFIGIVVTAQKKIQNVSRPLKVLKIDNLSKLHPTSLNWICTGLPSLEDVSLAGVKTLTTSHVEALLCSCPNIKHLMLDRSRNVSSDALITIARLPMGKHKMKELSVSHIAKGISNSSVHGLFLNCHSMRKLDLSKNTGITDDAFIDLQGTMGCAKTLQILNISHCNQVTSYGVASVTSYCRKLEYLDISSIVHVNDTALTVIAGCCGHLRSLIANDCISITDIGIINVCKHCKHLTEVQLSLAPKDDDFSWTDGSLVQYSDAILESILHVAKNLKIVNLTNQQNIKLSSQWLLEEFPKYGNYMLQKLDIRGCANVEPLSLEQTLNLCYCLSDVTIDYKFFDSEVASKDFWYRCLRKSVYTQPYDEANVINQYALATKARTKEIVTTKARITQEKVKKTVSILPGFQIVVPRSDKNVLEYRDQYIRRRHVENFSAGVIQMKFRLFKIWKRFRRHVNAVKISNTFKLIMDRRKLEAALDKFSRNHAARVIQFHVFQKFIRRMYAARSIQRCYRAYRARMWMRSLKMKNAQAIRIQRLARGFLVRISDRYILSQIYLRMPPFWREVASLTQGMPLPKDVLSTGEAVQRFHHERYISKRNKADENYRPQLPIPPEVRGMGDECNPGSVSIDRFKGKKSGLLDEAVYDWQIRELTSSSRGMLSHILTNVARDNKLAPKMPKVIPQPFDKHPYVSLSDGRKVSFYSHSDTIFETEYLDKVANPEPPYLSTSKSFGKEPNPNSHMPLPGGSLPVHTFNMTFWPLTAKPTLGDPSTLEHDPHLNSFDVANNSRTPLFCEVCHSRLRMINCNTCKRGFCFFCAFRTHGTFDRRKHDIGIMEPRIVKAEPVGKSLVYHMEITQQVSHELSYLVRYMRSAAEVQRIQKEKEMLKEYEKQEELRRLAFLKAAQEDSDKHNAATKISLLYRCRKAREIVRNKRNQVSVEQLLRSDRRFQRSVVIIQKIYRMFSVRLWFHKKGVSFRSAKTKVKIGQSMGKSKKASQNKHLKKLIKKEEPFELSRHYCRLRAENARKKLIFHLQESYKDALLLLDGSIAYWLDAYEKLQPKIKVLEETREMYHTRHKEAQLDNVIKHTVLNSQEEEKKEMQARVLFMKYEAANVRLENCRNMQWWVTQFIRFCNRKKAAVVQRYKDTINRLSWVSMESAILTRMHFHIDERISALRELKKPELNTIADWVQPFSDQAHVRQSALDGQQETLIKEEVNKLDRDRESATQFDSLVQELLNGLAADNHLSSERIYLDGALKLEAYGSEDAIRHNEQILLLKAKQKLLTSSIIDELKVALQAKFDEEDATNLQLYAFPNDRLDMLPEEMHTIEAVVLDAFQPSHHCSLMDFMRVYLVQPWLAQQSVEDVRLEESIASKQLQVSTAKEQVKTLKEDIEVGKAREKEIEKLCKENAVEQNKYLELVPTDESFLEKQKRMESVAALKAERNMMEREKENIGIARQTSAKQIRPIETNQKQLEQEIIVVEEKLKARIEGRAKSMAEFFDIERNVCAKVLPTVTAQLYTIEDKQATAEKDIHVCQSIRSSDLALQEVIDGEISLEEHAIINVPREKYRFPLQAVLCNTQQKLPKPTESVFQTIGAQILSVAANEEFYSELKKVLMEEEEILKSFDKKRPDYEEAIKAFTASLVARRRQRALELDITHRLERLVEMRELRLVSMKKALFAAKALEREANQERARKKAEKKTFASVMAKNLKTAIRTAKDTIHDLRHQNDMEMDPEEMAMAEHIRENSKEGAAVKQEAIKFIKLTQGLEELRYFAKQNQHLRSKGLPHYVKMEKSIGNQAFIWTQSTQNPESYITNFELAHKDPENERYKTYDRKTKFEAITHDKIDMVIWIKRDIRRRQGICAIDISFTEADETKLVVEEFSKVGDSTLDVYGLPDISLWVKKVDKTAVQSGRTNTNKLVAEVLKVRTLLKEKPNDRNLQELVARLQDKLEEAHRKEKESEVQDPLQAMTEMMVMSEEDVELWLKWFKKVDKNLMGKITLDDCFDYFQVTPTPLNKEVFLHVDALDEDGLMEFGDFVRAVGTYCMFGKDEILRFIYVYADKERVGHLTYDQFIALLNTITPYQQDRMKRALKGLTKGYSLTMTLTKKSEVTFEDFKRLNEAFPVLFLPMFLLQDSMRERVRDKLYCTMNELRT